MNLCINDCYINNFHELLDITNKIDTDYDDANRQHIIDDVIISFDNGSLLEWLKEDNAIDNSIISEIEKLYSSYDENPEEYTIDSDLFETIFAILSNKKTKIFYDADDYIRIEKVCIKCNDQQITENKVFFNQSIISPYFITIQYVFKVLKPLNGIFRFILSCDQEKQSLTRYDIEVNISGVPVGGTVCSTEIVYLAHTELSSLPSGKYDMYLLKESNTTSFTGGEFFFILKNNLNTLPFPIQILSVELFDDKRKYISIDCFSRKAVIDVMKILNHRVNVKITYTVSTDQEMYFRLNPTMGKEQIIHIKKGTRGTQRTLIITIEHLDELDPGEYLFKLYQTNKELHKIVLCLYGKYSTLTLSPDKSMQLVSGYGSSGIFYLSRELYCKEANSPDKVMEEINQLNEKFKSIGYKISLPSITDIAQLSNYLEEAPNYEYIDEMEWNLMSKDERYAVKTKNVNEKKGFSRDQNWWVVGYRLKLIMPEQKEVGIYS